MEWNGTRSIKVKVKFTNSVIMHVVQRQKYFKLGHSTTTPRSAQKKKKKEEEEEAFGYRTNVTNK